jgi:hypothetical protein
MPDLFTGLGPTDLTAIFTAVFADVIAVRASRKLPPLVSAHLGKEQIRAEESPPRIVVVPSHNSYEYARKMGTQPPTGQIDAQNPAIIATRLMHFEAHLWGDESPTPGNPPTEQDLWYSFSSTIELEREFIGALMRQLGNITNPRSGLNVRLSDSRWTQPTDIVRLGRLLVLPFAVGTAVTDEPWTITIPARIAVDTQAQFPDGTSSDQGTFILPP